MATSDGLEWPLRILDLGWLSPFPIFTYQQVIAIWIQISFMKDYLEKSFWWKSNILPYFPTKAPWFQLYRGADFPTDRGCQDFDGQTSTVSHEIFRVHLSPFTYISANKGSSLVFSFSFILGYTTKSWHTSYEKFHLNAWEIFARYKLKFCHLFFISISWAPEL